MGVRIAYYINDSGKKLVDLIIKDYPFFRENYLNLNSESVETQKMALGDENLIRFLEQNDKIDDLDRFSDQIVNEIVQEYFLSSIDNLIKFNSTFDIIGPCLNKINYTGSSLLINQTNNDQLIKLWNYLIFGRSIKDGATSTSFSNDISLGFLSAEEQRELVQLLEVNFNINKSGFDLTGIILVLDVLKEMNEHSTELISTVDL
ncbi:MAG: hypothetical protein ACK5Z2_06560 [Bacteroidota bacterium]|jgi:hypothetical protein